MIDDFGLIAKEKMNLGNSWEVIKDQWSVSLYLNVFSLLLASYVFQGNECEEQFMIVRKEDKQLALYRLRDERIFAWNQELHVENIDELLFLFEIDFEAKVIAYIK